MNNNIQILSQNVRGLGDQFKRRKVFYWLHKSNAGIIFLQETHSSPECEKQWKAEWGGSNMIFAHGQTNARGVCIIIKNNVSIEIHNTIADENGRFLIVDVTINEVRLTLANIYGPNHDDPTFLLRFLS